MADSLNLATLNVAIEATGVTETQRSVDNLTSSVQQSGNTTRQSTNTMRGSFGNLSSSIKSTVSNTQIFGTTLGDLRNQLSSGEGATALLQGAVTGLTSALINMAVQALTTAISKLGDFISTGIEAASDLDEIQNVLDSAFGDSAEAVNDWATTVASAYGLTELQAKQYSSTLGAIFSGMNITGVQAVTMSEQMAQLTGDMASFYNLDHEVAFEKIKSGLTGETEPLKALGIVMNETNLSAFAMSQGITTAYSAMSESDKVILRYNYLINQTSLAHGDFAKTQDSYANVSASMENNMTSLSATLGAQLLPVLTQVKVAFNGLLENLSPVVELIGKLVGGMITTLVNMITPVIEIIKVLLATLKPVITVLNDILDVVLSVVGKIGTGLTTLVTLFAEKMGIIQDSTKKTAEYTTETIVSETNKALGYVDTAVDKWLKEQMDAYEETIRSRYGDSGSLANEIKIQEQLQRHEANLRESAESTRRAYENVEASKQEAIAKTTQAIENQQKAQEKASDTLKKDAETTLEVLGITYDIMFGGLFSGIKTGFDSFKKSISGNYATGTAYHPGGLAMVGENGRELIDLPRGSRVYTNRETENIMSGGSGGQVVNNYYATIDASKVQDFVDVTNAFSGYTQNVRMGV